MICEVVEVKMVLLSQIERDEVDFVTPCDYTCYHGVTTIGTCAAGSTYTPRHWFSKYPSKASPTWNLLKLFSPKSWLLIFISIVSVSIFLFITAKIGSSYFGLKTFTGEIVLSPFRQTGPSNYDIFL